MPTIITERRTGRIVDISDDPNARWDERYYDSRQVDAVPIGRNESLGLFTTLQDGTVIRKSAAEIEADFPDVRKKRLKAEAEAAEVEITAALDQIPAANPARIVLAGLFRMVKLLKERGD